MENPENFPVKKYYKYLSNCGIAPMYGPAEKAQTEFSRIHSERGALVFKERGNVLGRLHSATADLLQTDPTNISFMKNTAEGLSMIALGYPFQQGDEILSYIHEYPSNHYPWKLQESRGAKLKLIEDSGYQAIGAELLNTTESAFHSQLRPTGFTLEQIDAAITDRTKILALSHVQFTSGFAADLIEIGKLCKDRGIDFIVDCAQSLGVLPVYPEKMHISAIAASGWKWLLGPVGSGLLYTSPEFREKIATTMTGADLMIQGQDYLNHNWQPYQDARRFEYSTTSVSLAAALAATIEQNFAGQTDNIRRIEKVRNQVFLLQDEYFASDASRNIPLLKMPEKHRSGIVGLPVSEPEKFQAYLIEKNIIATVRGGFLRLAPHFYNDKTEVHAFSEACMQYKP